MTRDASAAASDPATSAWVAAHAGAGKTHTLANRVARLLLAGAAPQRILCLTFTKAAAAEMQHRLFAQLGEWAMLPDAELAARIQAIGGGDSDAMRLKEARRLFAQALETPGGLKILTLHAFCQIVLSRFPLEAGISPAFDVLDEQSARALIAQARAEVLERAGSGDMVLAAAVAHFVTEASEARLNDVLNAALGNDRRKLDRFFAALEQDGLAAALRRAHGAGDDDAAGIARGFCESLRAEIDTLHAVQSWLAGGGKDNVEAAARLTQMLESDLADGFGHLRAVLLTQKDEPRKSLAVKKLADARPDLLAWLMELQTRMCGALERQRAAEVAGLAHAALAIIAQVRNHYKVAKSRRGVLDYDDLIFHTVRLLEKPGAGSWVLYKLDGGIDHVLVDEAQDTSPEQWAILRKLTEEFFAGEGAARKPRTLFAVGDEKQSIFSFQGADPAQFDINRRHFLDLAQGAGFPFLDQPLTTSRRSAPEILSFVDTVFAEEDARAGLTSGGTALKHEAHRLAAKGGVELWPPIKPADAPEVDIYRPVDAVQPSSPAVMLAAQVADHIQEWLRRGAILPGHDRPIQPGDIMILLPRREPFGGEVIRQLKQRGIAVAGADRVVLTEQIAVMDLAALGRFVLQQDDDLTLAALLRSPLCFISEEELFALCHGRKDGLWRELSLRRAEKPAFAAAHAFLSAMLGRADFAPPFEFYSHALVALGAKERLLARLGPESADAIEEFLSLALAYEQNATPSLEGFLDWVERGGTEIKRDMERGRNEVRVMTVHGAKGLEADIVILPDTNALPRPPSQKGHLLYDGETVLFPASEQDAPEAVRAAKTREAESLRNEDRRLLYVALTRARERLIVCGFEGRNGIREGSWYRLAEAAARKLGVPVRRGEDEILRYGHFDGAAGPAAPQPRGEAPIPDWLARPAPQEDEHPRLLRPSDIAGAPPGFAPGAKNAVRFRRGLLVHALLARLPEIAPGKRADIALAFARARGLNDDAAQTLVAETLAVLDDPLFAPAFGPHSRAEAAILADVPELGRVNGRIDRLAVTDGEILILDFKTNRPPPARAEDVPPVYRAQMALYRAAAARIFPGRRIVTGLVFTDGPSLVELPDAILDAALAEIARNPGAKASP